jgi:ubiquinone/menaquinone biosynthesis C-methylase UbiE
MPRLRKPNRRPGYRVPRGRHIRHNRAVWDRVSTSYDRRSANMLGGSHAAAWGLFRLPEMELQLLGPVRGKRILEVGCGAARWSIALSRQGARTTGIDLSSSQLAKARALVKRSGARLPLVRGSIEQLPFRDALFDIVFCDWGAMTFSDPERSVPECARVLKRRGRFVFATASPLRYVTLDLRLDRQVARLVRPYFGDYRIDFGPNDPVEFNPPYGVWVDLFRRNELTVDRLVETRPSPGQGSGWLSRSDAKWARSWPVEAIWKLTKE